MRCAIFIDGAYLSFILKDEFGAENARREVVPFPIDFAKLPTAMADGREILRTYYYNCLPYQSETPTDVERERMANAQRFHRALQRLSRYEVRPGRLVKRFNECPECGHKHKTFNQKLVDTLLSIDLVNLAATTKIKDAILLAGDSDFIPAVKVAKEHGVNVILYHSENRTSYHDALWELCDDRFPITRDFVENIRMERTLPFRPRP